MRDGLCKHRVVTLRSLFGDSGALWWRRGYCEAGPWWKSGRKRSLGHTKGQTSQTFSSVARGLFSGFSGIWWMFLVRHVKKFGGVQTFVGRNNYYTRRKIMNNFWKAVVPRDQWTQICWCKIIYNFDEVGCDVKSIASQVEPATPSGGPFHKTLALSCKPLEFSAQQVARTHTYFDKLLWDFANCKSVSFCTICVGTSSLFNGLLTGISDFESRGWAKSAL